MRRRLQKRLWASDGDPGPTAWLIASISLVLPVLGLGLCVLGGGALIGGRDGGWTLMGLGAAVLVLDVLIDFVWAHPGVSATDQPDLNQRGMQLRGRIVTVVEPITGGRGKVRVGDALWAAEGPDAAEHEQVRIVAARAMVLVVELLEEGEPER